MRYGGEYRTREGVVDRLETMSNQDDPMLFQSEGDKESFFTDCTTVQDQLRPPDSSRSGHVGQRCARDARTRYATPVEGDSAKSSAIQDAPVS